MDIFRQHEVFEMEVLDRMQSARVLDPLVFGGDSMLRLCHELNRYSVDLDFWIIKKISQIAYFNKLQGVLEADYEVTDSQIKHFTLLLEIRSARYPKRLKIEVRKESKKCDFQETIAFSKNSTKQVILKAHTLRQTMLNKIDAFLDRAEIRDCFDIEFLLRRGVALPELTTAQIDMLLKKIRLFREKDFRVKLGSILESDIRDYYTKNRFSLLEGKLISGVPEKI